jgi:hypothetical protein
VTNRNTQYSRLFPSPIHVPVYGYVYIDNDKYSNDDDNNADVVNDDDNDHKKIHKLQPTNSFIHIYLYMSVTYLNNHTHIQICIFICAYPNNHDDHQVPLHTFHTHHNGWREDNP